jgi:hypothetical protein
MDRLAVAVIIIAGLYLVGLAAASFVAPAMARRFLLGFAGSAFAHYLELGIRLIVGGAFVLHAPKMLFEGAFAALGWVLVITTAGLLAVPWHWHQRFARLAVPQVVRHFRLLGIAALALGGLVLLAIFYDAT